MLLVKRYLGWVAMSPNGRFCCKSHFAEGVKNSEGRRLGFSLEM
jgi:hypothetical protein